MTRQSIGQILGMITNKMSQAIDVNDCMTGGAISDFMHMESMYKNLGLTYMSEDLYLYLYQLIQYV